MIYLKVVFQPQNTALSIRKNPNINSRSVTPHLNFIIFAHLCLDYKKSFSTFAYQLQKIPIL